MRTISKTEQIDVRNGTGVTYGQMVDLGRVLDAAAKNAIDHHETIRRLIRTLHEGCEPRVDIANARYAYAIMDGVRYWRELEGRLLKYEPTADEKMAGYERLAELTGPVGVASTIAEKFGVQDGPDGAFEWPYARVFMVLRIDLERYKYNKRLAEIRENKRKNESRRSRRR